jgi:hypothetical protein
MNRSTINTAQTGKGRGRGWGYVDAVKQHISLFFGWPFKYFEIFEDLRVYFDSIQVSNTVLSEEVECYFVGWFKRDMFEAEGTTSHSISFIFTLFIPCSERETIDQVHCRCTLSDFREFVFQVSCVILSDRVDVVLMSTPPDRG